LQRKQTERPIYGGEEWVCDVEVERHRNAIFAALLGKEIKRLPRGPISRVESSRRAGSLGKRLLSSSTLGFAGTY